jgi:hypothetical protein
VGCEDKKSVIHDGGPAGNCRIIGGVRKEAAKTKQKHNIKRKRKLN